MRHDVIEHWLLMLKVRVGVDDEDAERLLAALRAFCDAKGVTPEDLLVRWEEFPELTTRKHPTSGIFPNLAVESFLIHNGVNVFGEIKCVSGTAEDLVEQGAQFVPASRETS